MICGRRCNNCNTESPKDLVWLPLMALRTKWSNSVARLHYFVPRGAIPSQDCTTSYHVEQSRRKITLLCTKWSCIVARLYYFVPRGARITMSLYYLVLGEQNSCEIGLLRNERSRKGMVVACRASEQRCIAER